MQQLRGFIMKIMEQQFIKQLKKKKLINFKNIYNFIKNRKKGFLMKIAQKKYLIELQEKKNKYKKFLDNEIPLTEKAKKS